MTGKGEADARRFLFLIPAALLAAGPFFQAGWSLPYRFFVPMGLAVFFAAAVFLFSDDLGARYRNPGFMALFLFLIFSLFSAFKSPFPHGARPGFLSDLSAAGFFMAATIPSGKKIIRMTLILSGAFAALASLAISPLIHPGSWRGTFPNSNLLAGYLVLLWPLIISMLSEADNSARRILWAGISASTLWVLYGTGSLMAFIVVGIQILWMLKKKSAGFFQFAAVIVLTMGAVFLGNKWQKLFHWETDRFMWWESAIRMAAANPLLGVGPGAFGEAYAGFKSDIWGKNSLFAHNFALEFISERGFFAAVALGVLTVVILIREKEFFARKSEGFLLGLGGFLIFNTVHIGFSFPALNWAFWSAAGLAFGPEEIQRPPLQKGGYLKLFPFISFAVWAAAALFSFRCLKAERALSAARILMEENRIDPAERRLNESLFWNSREPEAHALLGRIRVFQGRYDDALRFFLEAITLSPYTSRWYEEAGRLEMRRGNGFAAMGYLEKASNFLSLNPYLWIEKARIWARHGQIFQARRCYETAERLLKNPDVLSGKRDERKKLMSAVEIEMNALPPP